MGHIWEKSTKWLLPVLLILFILEVIAFPFAVDLTYAGRSENPDYTLTYQNNRLSWSNVPGILENGTAELSLFDAKYKNVQSTDGNAIVAPGTEGFHIIRLHNSAPRSVAYTAVLYAIKSSEKLPVDVNMENPGSQDAPQPVLPEGVREEQIIRCVTGKIGAGEVSDFDILWLWNYFVSREQDLVDLDLGNKSVNGNPEDITVGFYLVVEDSGTSVTPQTGDKTQLTLYLTLMAISGGAVLLLLITKKREKVAK